jgi:hypothetical protein
MRLRLAWTLLVLGVLAPAAVRAAAPQSHSPEGNRGTNAALQQFKSLAGEWEGKDTQGKMVHASYESLPSGVVMERLEAEGGPSMTTMFSLDGDHILATHFCAEGNQPILRTESISEATRSTTSLWTGSMACDRRTKRTWWSWW